MSKNKSHFANPRYLRNSPALYTRDYGDKAISIKKVLIVIFVMAAGSYFVSGII